ncbi:MAG: DUF3180 domain-containing protein [Actinomycetota bacterium]|nr:DUF3180 domain-containing protein [Actinomycetota bacterium]
MTVTRPRDLSVAAVAAVFVVHLLLQVGYGSLPTLPTLGGTTLLAFAAAETALGFSLRARIQRRPGAQPVQALMAARAVALAKASSLAGALVTGAWLGVLAYVLPRRADLAAAASDTVAATIGAVCAAALVAAGLWLEHCCRTPDDPHRGPGRDDGATDH